MHRGARRWIAGAALVAAFACGGAAPPASAAAQASRTTRAERSWTEVAIRSLVPTLSLDHAPASERERRWLALGARVAAGEAPAELRLPRPSADVFDRVMAAVLRVYGGPRALYRAGLPMDGSIRLLDDRRVSAQWNEEWQRLMIVLSPAQREDAQTALAAATHLWVCENELASARWARTVRRSDPLRAQVPVACLRNLSEHWPRLPVPARLLPSVRAYYRALLEPEAPGAAEALARVGAASRQSCTTAWGWMLAADAALEVRGAPETFGLQLAAEGSLRGDAVLGVAAPLYATARDEDSRARARAHYARAAATGCDAPRLALELAQRALLVSDSPFGTPAELERLGTSAQALGLHRRALLLRAAAATLLDSTDQMVAQLGRAHEVGDVEMVASVTELALAIASRAPRAALERPEPSVASALARWLSERGYDHEALQVQHWRARQREAEGRAMAAVAHFHEAAQASRRYVEALEAIVPFDLELGMRLLPDVGAARANHALLLQATLVHLMHSAVIEASPSADRLFEQALAQAAEDLPRIAGAGSAAEVIAAYRAMRAWQECLWRLEVAASSCAQRVAAIEAFELGPHGSRIGAVAFDDALASCDGARRARALARAATAAETGMGQLVGLLPRPVPQDAGVEIYLERRRLFAETLGSLRALVTILRAPAPAIAATEALPRLRPFPEAWTQIALLRAAALAQAGRTADARALLVEIDGLPRLGATTPDLDELGELVRFEVAARENDPQAALLSIVRGGSAWTRTLAVRTGLRPLAPQTAEIAALERRHALAGALSPTESARLRELQSARRGSVERAQYGAQEVRRFVGRVPDDASVVVYWRAFEALYSLHVRRGRARLTRVDASFEELGAAVRELDQLVSHDLPSDEAPADRLHRWLLAPLGADLAHKVVIVPGPLANVPFEVLRDAQGRRLGAEHATVVTPVLLRRFPREATPTQGRTPLIAGANGDVLHAAEAEAQAVHAELGGTALIGHAATRGAFLEALERSDIVHLAAHVALSADNPWFAEFHLGGGDRVALWEMARHVRSSRLLVLSGCETFRSPTSLSFGVSTVLHLAGVDTLVGSRWPVSDDGTARLMRVFYRDLRAGRSVPEALRRARAELSASSRPYVWAAFVVSTDSAETALTSL